MLHQINHPIASSKVLISGSGNVAQYAALKVLELGGHVLSLSDSKGSLIAKQHDAGFTKEDIAVIAQIKLDRGYLKGFAEEPHVQERFEYHEGKDFPSRFSNVKVA
jgi:glutamate dehydrogenase (NADP+)